ncbi:MAG: hypothetical protein JWQ96_26 [Segetibacter sp.]|nr:hypothetical protein [Segetibacter sp.]
MLNKSNNQKYKNSGTTFSGMLLLVLVIINAIILKFVFIHEGSSYTTLTVTLPLLATSLIYHKRKMVINKRTSNSIKINRSRKPTLV